MLRATRRRIIGGVTLWLVSGAQSLATPPADAVGTTCGAGSSRAVATGDDKSIETLRNEISDLRQKVDKPPKDFWDKVTSVSGLASGLAVALIGFYATNVYNKRQRIAEERRKDQELTISQIQTVEKFIPHLGSGNEQIKAAALVAIFALGNEQLAIRLARTFGGSGATSALTTIAATPGSSGAAASAQHALLDVFRYLEARVVTVHGKHGLEARRGSGFVVREGGFIVTTAHVVESISARELAIGLPSDIVVPATIVRVDTSIDLALLHAETDEVLASIDNAPSNLAIGEPVTALLIGHKAQRRIEVGAVVGLEATMPDSAGRQHRKIITSLPAEPGASGSPVVDKEGRLVGLVHSANPDRKVTFLISADDVFSFIGRQDETAHVHNL